LSSSNIYNLILIFQGHDEIYYFVNSFLLLQGFYLIFGCYPEIVSQETSFIKTTYDISLDSQISLLPLGFSLLGALRHLECNEWCPRVRENQEGNCPRRALPTPRPLFLSRGEWESRGGPEGERGDQTVTTNEIMFALRRMLSPWSPSPSGTPPLTPTNEFLVSTWTPPARAGTHLWEIP
jgi:hypothetical protein